MVAMKAFVLFSLGTVVFAFSEDYVKELAHNLKEKTNSDLVNQMAAFQRANVLYLAYASYFDRSNVNLPGFRKFFLTASDRALKDSQRIIDYINLRGGHQQFPVIKLHTACKAMKASFMGVSRKFPNYHPTICNILQNNDKKSPTKAIYGLKQKQTKSSDADWQKGLLALSDALMLERNLQNQLINLGLTAGKRNDRHLRHTVEKVFLGPQAKRVKRLAEVITKLRKYDKEDYPLGEYVIDLQLSG